MRLLQLLSALACTCPVSEGLGLLAPLRRQSPNLSPNNALPDAAASFASVAYPLLATTKHTSQFRISVNEIRRVIGGGYRIFNGWEQIKEIVGPADCALVAFCIFAYNPLLRVLYQLQEALRGRFFPSAPSSSYEHTFEYSFFGFMEKPLRFLAYYLPFLYLVDFFSIALHALGFDSHLKGDVPRLAATVGGRITLGHFVINLKDWVLHNQRLLSNRRRDKIRENTVDELTSIAIWTVVFSSCVEAMKMQMGA